MKFSHLFYIFLAAFIVRAVFCFFVPIPMEKDSLGYNRLALNLISSHRLSYDGTTPTLFRGPGYPLFLAGIYSILGYNPVAARLTQAFLGAAMCLVFFYLARQYTDKNLSMYVLILSAFHPALVALSSFLLSESVFTFFLGVAVLILTHAFKEKNKAAYFFSGVFFGITALTRSITAYFAPFLLFAQFIFYKSKKLLLSHVCLFLCGQLLIILPWTLRNYAVTGQFCPVATGGGIAMWLGTYTPGKGYDLGMNAEVCKKYEEIVGKDSSYTTLTNDRKLFKASIENIKNDPLGYLLLMPVKFQRMFITTYSSFFNLHQVSLAHYVKNPHRIFKNPFAPLWKAFMLILSVATVGFGLIGVWKIRQEMVRFLPLITVIGFFIIFHTLTFASARSGIPVLPFLFIFTVIGFKNI